MFAERTGPGTPAFAARRMVITPGFERVDLVMDPSGFLEVRIGSSPHGQGLKTALAQLIADETGVAPDRIRVIAGDTDRSPYGWGTFRQPLAGNRRRCLQARGCDVTRPPASGCRPAIGG